MTTDCYCTARSAILPKAYAYRPFMNAAEGGHVVHKISEAESVWQWKKQPVIIGYCKTRYSVTAEGNWEKYFTLLYFLVKTFVHIEIHQQSQASSNRLTTGINNDFERNLAELTQVTVKITFGNHVFQSNNLEYEDLDILEHHDGNAESVTHLKPHHSTLGNMVLIDQKP